MKNSKYFILLFGLLLSPILKAQEIPVIEDRETAILEPLRLSGPRVGLSFVPQIKNFGISELIGDTTFNPNPFVSQFGWQFEWRYFETRGGSAGLFEVIPMLGGLDQGLVIPSVNLITGYRSPSGFEFGAGPNISLLSSGFSAAVGYAFKSEHMYFPINFAMTKSRDGTRYSVIFGFSKRSR
tara:strand:+ start:3607 stop:4152 length:546 start_codon:yes stop_codon:yes gene_type:complete